MRNEIEFCLAICQYLSPDQERIEELLLQPLDFPYILGQLLYNRAGGAACYTLEKLSLLGKMNREFRTTLQTIYETNKIKSGSLCQALDFTADMLKDADFPYALLKGSYLVSQYPLGLRTSNDIDLLLNFDSLTAVSQILLNNGFVQGYIRNGEIVKAKRAEIISSQINRGETVPFIKEIGLPHMPFLEIDINFSLDFKPGQTTDVVEKMLGQAVPAIAIGEKRLHTLCPEDFLIQLCAHLYKEATVYDWVRFGRDQGLYKYLDLYLFCNLFPDLLASAQLVNRIKEFSVEKECFYALRGASTLFCSCDTDNLRKLLADISPADHSFLNEIISPADGKRYRYSEDIKEWVFCSERGLRLNEVDA